MLENMCVSLCVSVCVSVQQGQQGQREDNEATRRAQEENLFQFKNFRHARNTKSELTATVFSSVLCPLPPATPNTILPALGVSSLGWCGGVAICIIAGVL